MERKRTGWENATSEITTNFQGKPLAVLKANCGMPSTEPPICLDFAGLRARIRELKNDGIISRKDAIIWQLQITLSTPIRESSQSGFCYDISRLRRESCNATLTSGHVLTHPKAQK